jgi:hypothetical protein
MIRIIQFIHMFYVQNQMNSWFKSNVVLKANRYIKPWIEISDIFRNTKSEIWKLLVTEFYDLILIYDN